MRDASLSLAINIAYRQADAAAEAFNQQHQVGDRVIYWSGARQGVGKVGVTKGEAFVMGGHTAVVRVTGPAGSDTIALTHVQPIPGDLNERVDQALEAATDAVHGLWPQLTGTELVREAAEVLARTAISAYLEAAI